MKNKLVPRINDCFYCTFWSYDKKRYYSSSGNQFFGPVGGTEVAFRDIVENVLYWYNSYSRGFHGLAWKDGDNVYWVPWDHGLDESFIHEMRENGIPLNKVMDLFLL
jgi:hypothetical protein